MPRGGKREGAGRKTTWASGRGIEDTTVIRVPKEFASKLLEIAHKLDAGASIDFVTNSNYDTVTQSNITTLPTQVVDSAASTESVALQEEVVAESVTESKQVEIELVTESKPVQKELVTESKNEINELVTNSVNESEDDQTSLVVHPKVEALSKITSAQMAERMEMSSKTLASHKNRKSSKKFLEFLKTTDPEGISWCPVKEGGKLFYVILEKETKS